MKQRKKMLSVYTVARYCSDKADVQYGIDEIMFRIGEMRNANKTSPYYFFVRLTKLEEKLELLTKKRNRMKSTVHYKNAIKAYLDKRANEDSLFAVTYTKANKNLDSCLTYILNTVWKSGCNGFADDEIYSMAVHYYDEDNIEAGKPIDCRVVVNHTVELTAEEKEQARQKAIQQVHSEVYSSMKQPLRKPQSKQTAVTNQPTLFDF
jgi:hypothetical protein